MNVPPRSRGAALAQAQRSFVIRQVGLPVQSFIHTAGRSSVALLVATLVALIWANIPWGETYSQFWETMITLDLRFTSIEENLRGWVENGLMTIFFFMVGLELKQELVQGELSSPRDAAFPALAALGGMVVPASIYMALNFGGRGFSGWGIPLAMDTAFALGVLALLGDRVPSQAKVFLLALAVVDDVGAILVIAIFYTQNLSLNALGVAALLCASIFIMNRLGVRNLAFYIIVGTVFWGAALKSGVHATIAGVVLAALTPARPYFGMRNFEGQAKELLDHFHRNIQNEEYEEAQGILGQMEELTVGTEAPTERMERLVGPWVSYAILPIFALSYAGVELSGNILQEAVTSRISLGVLLGLLVGKPLGIISFSWLTVRLGVGAKLPELTWHHVVGIGLLSGIGFTVSLFITGLAFTEEALISQAKVGILAASVLAGLVGYIFLRFTGKRAGPEATRAATEPSTVSARETN
jgi:NhaA family Na+:H+ antiporter